MWEVGTVVLEGAHPPTTIQRKHSAGLCRDLAAHRIDEESAKLHLNQEGVEAFVIPCTAEDVIKVVEERGALYVWVCLESRSTRFA